MFASEGDSVGHWRRHLLKISVLAIHGDHVMPAEANLAQKHLASSLFINSPHVVSNKDHLFDIIILRHFRCPV